MSIKETHVVKNCKDHIIEFNPLITFVSVTVDDYDISQNKDGSLSVRGLNANRGVSSTIQPFGEVDIPYLNIKKCPEQNKWMFTTTKTTRTGRTS